MQHSETQSGFYRLAVFFSFCFYFPIPDNFGILATSVLFWENSAPQVFSATQPPRCGRLRMQFFFGASPDAISFIFVVCAFPWSRQHYFHTSKAHHCSPVCSSILYASGSRAVCFWSVLSVWFVAGCIRQHFHLRAFRFGGGVHSFPWSPGSCPSNKLQPAC